MPDERRAGTVRLPAEVREMVDRYAKAHGLRYNAAVGVLVVKGLAAEGIPVLPATAGQ